MAKKNTFGHQAHNIFSDLPKTTRVVKDGKVLIKEPKSSYRVKALARSLSL